MKNNYTVELMPLSWQITFETDDDFKYEDGDSLEAGMKQMLCFWTGGESRINREDGQIKVAFLKMLAEECFRIAASNNFNVFGIINEFACKEGWTAIDGRFGIKLLHCDTVEFNYDDFIVE